MALFGGGGVVAAAAFSPTDIANLKLWVKADAGTFQTSGGAAAAADGDPVGEWQDQSGQGNHLAQATAAKRPTLQLDEQNGKPAIRTDGVDDWLQKAFAFNQPVTVFIVMKKLAGETGKGPYDGNSPGNTGDLYYPTATTQRLYAGALISGTVLDSGIRLIHFVLNGATSELFQNGISIASGNAGATNPAGVTVGAFGDGSLPSASDYFEIVAYTGALSAADQTRVTDYLRSAARWSF